MKEPIWVPFQVITIVHDRQISRHGGAPGIGDIGLLESGCSRAKNKFEYEECSLFELASAYAFGIAKAHAFVDGNKRTAFVTALTFLRLNGFEFRTDPVTGVQMMEGLASGEVSEDYFAKWLEIGSEVIS